MPYTQNDDVEIFYDAVGEGYPIVLQHGLTDRHEGWYGRAREVNYVEALQDKYRVILLDARGHGKSGKPHAPEKYAAKYMVGDIIAVLDELNIEKSLFWGYSMGGRIGLAAAKYAPERFSAYVIGGKGISEKDSKEEREELQGYIRLFENGNEHFIDFLEKRRGSRLQDWEYEMWRCADTEAFIAYMSYYENIGLTDYLPKVLAPFLFYAGTEDKHPHATAKNCSEIMPNAEFVSLIGLNHSGASIGTYPPLPHVLSFLDKVSNR
jgi:pimeloyl-ACP methyl ester carboxylesterase